MSSALRAGSSRPLHKGQVNEPQNTQFRGPRDPARSPQFCATLIKDSSLVVTESREQAWSAYSRTVVHLCPQGLEGALAGPHWLLDVGELGPFLKPQTVSLTPSCLGVDG